MSHSLRMLLGCLLPFMLIFVLPLLGAGEGLTLLLVVVLMFGCHLLMMTGHGEHAHENRSNKREGGDHEHS